TVRDEAGEAVAPLSALEARLREMEAAMAEHAAGDSLSALMEEYARATERFENQGGYEAESRVTGVLTGLGFSAAQMDQRAETLSGGELTRLGLAKLLLQQPDLLLLDEPTNHLDMQTLSWLEGYLREYRGTVIMVSHDRYFLDAVCTGMAELLFGELESYRGNYSAYIAQRAERHAAREKAYELQQREISRQRAIIARFRSFNREKSIRAAESREKALERMEVLDKPSDTRQIAFRFEAARRIGDIAMRAKGLTKRFGDRVLFEGLGFTLRGGDRAALIGPNGIGKTTLLSCVLGREPLDDGEVDFAPKADIGYFDQRHEDLDPEKDVLSEVWDTFPLLPQSRVRGALGLFLFSGDDVFTPVRLLSGGERSRVSLAKLMLRRDNLLVLDEPTNHLDADSREALEQALLGYEGTILTVSHDRYFINRVANRVLVMDEGGVTSYEGNYDAYLAELQRAQEGSGPAAPALTKTESQKLKREQKARDDREKELRDALAAAEREANRAQALLDEALDKQADPEVYSSPEKAAAQAKLCRQLKARADDLFVLWDEAEQALARFLEPGAQAAD
ncbi:MAG TPA: ABC-F family ATP-binding cassette domain-containing protein, partial [Candidatus Limnocylindria bacterium]|nr:ABC-F family ATP-binding cassette domain-containing protein [Candidatus Limnocylindria bacterium]